MYVNVHKIFFCSFSNANTVRVSKSKLYKKKPLLDRNARGKKGRLSFFYKILTEKTLGPRDPSLFYMYIYIYIYTHKIDRTL
jgi:hypothetical protein